MIVELCANNTQCRGTTARKAQEMKELGADVASELLARCGGEVKSTILVELCQVDPVAARARLANVNGQLRRALLQ